MAEKIVIAELELNTKALQESNTQLIQDIQKLRAEQKELMKDTDGLKNATDEQAKKFVENDAALKNLSNQYNNNKKLLSENITGVVGLNDAIDKEIKSIDDAKRNNQQLLLIRSQINTTTKEGADAIAEINAKLDQNTEFIRENVSASEQQKMSIGGYKEQIKGAFADLNIFNGGLGGFIERSQQAGGTGNLLKNSFNSIKEGVIGATKASLGFIATPLGAVIAAIAVVLGVLYSVFKNFTPVVDKAEQAMAAIGAVFNVVKNTIIGLVTGTKSLSEAFSGLGSSMKDAAVAAAELKKAQQDLEDAQGILEISTAKANRQINEYLLKSKDRTLSEQERIRYLQLAQSTEKNLFNEKKRIADEELRIAQQQLINGSTMSAKEIKLLKEKGYEYAKVLQDKYALTDEDIDKLKDALIKRENILNDSISIQEKAQNKVNALYEKQDADREKAAQKAEEKRKEAQQKAEEARQKAEEKRQKAQDTTIQKMNDELQIFQTRESQKKKTLEQSIAFEQQVMQKRIDILNKEKEFGKKTATQYQAEKLQIEVEGKQKIAELAVKNLQEQAALYLAENQSRLDGAKTLTDLLVEEERTRQEKIFQQQLEIIQKQHEAGLSSENEFLTQKLNLQNEHNKQKKELDEKFEAQKREERKLIEQTNFDADVLEMQERNASQFELELARIAYEEQTKIEAIDEIQIPIRDQKLADNQLQYEQGLISETQYNANRLAIVSAYENLISNVKRNATVSQDKVRVAAQQAQLSGAANVAGGIAQIAGEQSAVGKAAAIAQATINTYQGASLALATYPPPFSYVAVAATIASGIAQVAKIAGVKGAEGVANGLSSVASGVGQIGAAQIPKAEKGALFKIGGKRHSQGGTKFQGEDGTAFEAEQGEIIGVMNRNAASAFMDFNNRFRTAGYRTNYFASGGVVARQNQQSTGLDVDTLAYKIGANVAMANANLPNPVVAVTDINDGQNSYVQVVNGSDVF